MEDHVLKQKEQDRIDYVKHMLFGQKRTFKNFIDNNSNQLRKVTSNRKRDLLEQIEAKEKEIHSYVNNSNINNIKYRNYNEKALVLLKPTTSIQALKKSTERSNRHMSMSLGPHNNHKSGTGKIKPNVGYYLSNT